MKDLPEVFQPFIYYGFKPRGESSEQVYGDCPFCRQSKMYINPDTGQWICYNGDCGRKGNKVSFLDSYADHVAVISSRKRLESLAKYRGIPIEILDAYRVGYDERLAKYLIPIASSTGFIHDIRNYAFNKGMRSTKGCKTQLLNSQFIKDSNRILLVAGEFDTMAADWMIQHEDLDMLPVGVPGESVFKKEWIDLFRGKDVSIIYDNDSAGEKGMARVGGCEGWPKEDSRLMDGAIRGVASSIKYIHWSEDTPEGFDTSDLVAEGIDDAWSIIRVNLKSNHPRGTSTKVKAKPRNTERLTFSHLIKEYQKWLMMDHDTVTALKIIYGTVFSVNFSGDPVWIYLVGPSGIGKTELIKSLRESDGVEYRSSITPNTLVSGWKSSDPSLIPQLDGKCLLLKDLTEILAQGEMATEEVMSILRGAFDGFVEKSYGNGVHRMYESHFSMVAGVTGVIHGLTAKGVALGDRFLKYQIRKSPKITREQVRSAMDGLQKEHERDDALSTISADFVDQRFSELDISQFSYPSWFRDRVTDLVELASLLRAPVPRSGDNRNTIRYRPEIQIGSRMSKQLAKLGFGICAVEDKTEIDWHIYKTLRRVALDTAEGFNHDIIRACMELGTGKEVGRDVQLAELAEHSDIPRDTLRDHLDDLSVLGLMYPKKVKGSFESRWNVSPMLRRLWSRVEAEGEADEDEDING